jgi:hypothetical protein
MVQPSGEAGNCGVGGIAAATIIGDTSSSWRTVECFELRQSHRPWAFVEMCPAVRDPLDVSARRRVLFHCSFESAVEVSWELPQRTCRWPHTSSTWCRHPKTEQVPTRTVDMLTQAFMHALCLPNTQTIGQWIQCRGACPCIGSTGLAGLSHAQGFVHNSYHTGTIGWCEHRPCSFVRRGPTSPDHAPR